MKTHEELVTLLRGEAAKARDRAAELSLHIVQEILDTPSKCEGWPDPLRDELTMVMKYITRFKTFKRAAEHAVASGQDEEMPTIP